MNIKVQVTRSFGLCLFHLIIIVISGFSVCRFIVIYYSFRGLSYIGDLENAYE
jgi:hypothetical protein